MVQNENVEKGGLLSPFSPNKLETCRGYRRYISFWLGQLVSLLGSSIASFVLVWWMTVFTKSTFILGLASLLAFGPSVLLTPFAGVFVDRLNRKYIIGLVDFLQAGTTLILIIIFWLNFEPGIILVVFLGAIAFRGILQSFHVPAVTSLAPIMIPPGKLQQFNSWNYLGTALVSLIGPVIAAFLLLSFKIHLILWIDVFTFLLAILPLIRIEIPKMQKLRESTTINPSFKQEFTAGISLIKNTQGLLALAMVASVLNLLVTPLITLFPYFVNVTHQGDITDLAFIMMFFQAGLVAGSIFMSLKNEFQQKILVMYSLIYVEFLGYGVIALTPNAPDVFVVMAAAMLLIGFCIPIVNILFQTIIQQKVPPEMQGRVMSVILTVTGSISPLGMFFSGILAEIVDITTLFFVCVLVGIVGFTCALMATDIRYLGRNQPKAYEVVT